MTTLTKAQMASELATMRESNEKMLAIIQSLQTQPAAPAAAEEPAPAAPTKYVKPADYVCGCPLCSGDGVVVYASGVHECPRCAGKKYMNRQDIDRADAYFDIRADRAEAKRKAQVAAMFAVNTARKNGLVHA